jgi:hypothetical protein
MKERIKELAEQATTIEYGADRGFDRVTFDKEKFAALIRADEREAIAKMFEDAPALVPFAQNDKGGCMMCGFTPKLAMEAIRARGNT